MNSPHAEVYERLAAHSEIVGEIDLHGCVYAPLSSRTTLSASTGAWARVRQSEFRTERTAWSRSYSHGPSNERPTGCVIAHSMRDLKHQTTVAVGEACPDGLITRYPHRTGRHAPCAV